MNALDQLLIEAKSFAANPLNTAVRRAAAVTARNCAIISGAAPSIERSADALRILLDIQMEFTATPSLLTLGKGAAELVDAIRLERAHLAREQMARAARERQPWHIAMEREDA